MRRFKNVSLSSLLAGVALSLTAFACGGKVTEKAAALTESAPKAREVKPSELFANPLEIPGFPEYRLTPMKDEAQIDRLYSSLSRDLTLDMWDRCSERAHIWSYQLWRGAEGVDSGKVFLFYTATMYPGHVYPTRNTGNPSGKLWIWHAAPYVASENGQLKVLENFAKVKSPMLMKDWLRYHTNGSECVELKGNEADLLSYTCGKIEADGQCSRGAPGMILVPKGGPKCYFRRVPQYYTYPRDVANHDFLKMSAKTGWSSSQLYSTCKKVMNSTTSDPDTKCHEMIPDAPTEDVLEEAFYRIDADARVDQPAQYRGIMNPAASQ